MSIERSAKHENAVLIFSPRNACPLEIPFVHFSENYNYANRGET